MVERTCIYTVHHTGGALASYLSAPGSYTVSLGASGAIFGLFAVGVLSKLSFNPRKLLEAFVLGQFVVSQVLQVRCGGPTIIVVYLPHGAMPRR